MPREILFMFFFYLIFKQYIGFMFHGPSVAMFFPDVLDGGVAFHGDHLAFRME